MGMRSMNDTPPIKGKTRVEYIAIAVDPKGGDDDYEGEIADTAHKAHMKLEEGWTVDDREVVLKRRSVTESEWIRIAEA
jgi:hypothetical protein